MVGYIAAAVSQTEKVGFVGGIHSDPIDQFQYGFEAGVAYANKVLNKKVGVIVQYAESFSDAAKGKSIANKMLTARRTAVTSSITRREAPGPALSKRPRSTANMPSASTATRPIWLRTMS